MEFVYVGTNIRPTCAVIGFEELIHVPIVFFFGHIGIPHQLREQIRAQFTKFTRFRLAVALREHPFYIVLGIKLHIFAKRAEVSKRGDIKSVIRRVIPNVEAITNFTPIFNILLELHVVSKSAFSLWMYITVVICTKTHANVIARNGHFRCSLCILVSKCVDDKIGVICFQIFCNGINETEHQTGGGAFLCNDRCAVFTSTVFLVVVL